MAKKAIFVALMALAAGLFVIVPEDEQSYALAASVEDLTAEDKGEPDGSSVLDSPAEANPESPTTPPSTFAVAGRSGSAAEDEDSRLALATEAALAGAEHSLTNGLAILTFADGMEQARSAALAADQAEAEPTTTVRPTTVPPTTAAPTTAAETTSAAEPAETSAPDAAAASDTAEEGAETTAAETTTSETAAETTIPETTEPETTVPETTTTAAPADPALVGTGNGVQVPPVLLAIRYCESRDNYGAANPASSARGGYQFLTGSWAAYGHKDRYGVNQAHLATPAQQDEAALITWQRDGTRPWNASKSCWSKRI